MPRVKFARENVLANCTVLSQWIYSLTCFIILISRKWISEYTRWVAILVSRLILMIRLSQCSLLVSQEKKCYYSLGNKQKRKTIVMFSHKWIYSLSCYIILLQANILASCYFSPTTYLDDATVSRGLIAWVTEKKNHLNSFSLSDFFFTLYSYVISNGKQKTCSSGPDTFKYTCQDEYRDSNMGNVET